jgi:ubiquinone biosynthesis protein
MNTMKEPISKESSSGERFKEILAVLGRYNLIHGLTPEKLRHILEDLGPTFIKLGQILSMRPDMIPEDYCKELAHLRSEVRPMDSGVVIALLEREYGRPYDAVFSSLEGTPLGSASIAQVHSAVLKNGRKVVVKVQRPGIYERMDLDIRLLHKTSGIIKIISKTGKVINFNAVLDEMWAVAKQEMDFLAEAEHIKKFSKLNEDILYVAFPRVEGDFTTSKVLCMEQIDGIQIDDTEELLREGYDLTDIAEKLAANYCKQVIDDGFFQADPHPGNIRIRGGKIVWIDLGMTGTLSVRDRQLLKRAITALVNNDVYELKTAILGISVHKGEINHSRLTSGIEDLLNQYGSLELGNMAIGPILSQIISLAEENGLPMPAGVTMLGRGILTLEGVLSKINPDTNVIQVFSAVMSRSLLEDFNLRQALEKNGRSLLNLGSKSMDLSVSLIDLLKLASKGQAKLNVELTGSAEPLSKINRMVNRMIVCILNAAILIGSSLICLTDMRPKLLEIPLFGIFGYLASLILSVWLLADIIKKRKL